MKEFALPFGILARLSLVLLAAPSPSLPQLSGSASASGSSNFACPIADCTDGTVATYIGTTCSQECRVIFSFTSYTCTSTPASICTALDGAGSAGSGAGIAMVMDRSSLAAENTIIIGKTSAWNIGPNAPNENVDVVINGTVYGGVQNQSWPHPVNSQCPGTNCTTDWMQAGNGTVETIVTVGCAAGSNCTDGNNGVSDILCNAANYAAGPPTSTYCSGATSIGTFPLAAFNRNTISNPYTWKVEIKLATGASNSDAASLYSVGEHVTFK